MNVSGGLVVQGNTAGKGANVYLTSDKALTVAGAMADGARVGVRFGSGQGHVCEGLCRQ